MCSNEDYNSPVLCLESEAKNPSTQSTPSTHLCTRSYVHIIVHLLFCFGLTDLSFNVSLNKIIRKDSIIFPFKSFQFQFSIDKMLFV